MHGMLYDVCGRTRKIVPVPVFILRHLYSILSFYIQEQGKTKQADGGAWAAWRWGKWGSIHHFLLSFPPWLPALPFFFYPTGWRGSGDSGRDQGGVTHIVGGNKVLLQAEKWRSERLREGHIVIQLQYSYAWRLCEGRRKKKRRAPSQACRRKAAALDLFI